MSGNARAMAGPTAQYWRINVLTTLEYRENFLMWLGLHGGLPRLGDRRAGGDLLHSFPSMNGWNFRDMAFLYALWMIGHALHNTLFSNVGDIPEHIRDGEFDRLLVRPLDPLFQVIATPGQVFPDELILALFTFAAATWYSGVHVDAVFLVFVPLDRGRRRADRPRAST